MKNGIATDRPLKLLSYSFDIDTIRYNANFHIMAYWKSQKARSSVGDEETLRDKYLELRPIPVIKRHQCCHHSPSVIFSVKWPRYLENGLTDAFLLTHGGQEVFYIVEINSKLVHVIER